MCSSNPCPQTSRELRLLAALSFSQSALFISRASFAGEGRRAQKSWFTQHSWIYVTVNILLRNCTASTSKSRTQKLWYHQIAILDWSPRELMQQRTIALCVALWGYRMSSCNSPLRLQCQLLGCAKDPRKVSSGNSKCHQIQIITTKLTIQPPHPPPKKTQNRALNTLREARTIMAFVKPETAKFIFQSRNPPFNSWKMFPWVKGGGAATADNLGNCLAWQTPRSSAQI